MTKKAKKWTKNTTQHMPYVYKIAWSTAKTWYIGCRYAPECSPEDLFSSYFTSSKHVKKFRHLHGDPDIIEILSIFETGEAARSYEQQILTAASAAQDPLSLNRHNGGKNFYGGEITAAHKEKLRQAALGKKRGPHTAAHKEKLRQAGLGKKGRKGTPLPAAHKAKIRTAQLGKKHSAETRAKMHAAKIARREKKIKNGTASKYQIRRHAEYLAKRGEPAADTTYDTTAYTSENEMPKWIELYRMIYDE
jgi:hypothetical protein